MNIIACIVSFVVGELCGVLTIALCIVGRSDNDDEEK